MASGQRGALLAGPYVAADLGHWRLEQPAAMVAGELEVTAEVVGRDRYWSEHGGPFDVRLELARSVWCWRAALVRDPGGRTISGRLRGPPEVRAR